MIVDSSALIAILRNEPDADVYAKAMGGAARLHMSVASYLETAIVIDASGSAIATRRFDDLIREASIVLEPVTARQAHIAREAYRDYGKGRGHRAQLNFGDCFAYALARDKGDTLLYKGDDFTHTDVASAL